MNMRKLAATTTLLLTGVLATASAHAGPNVQWQISVETPVIRLPGHVVLPLPPIPLPRVVVAAPYPGERAWREPSRWDRDGDGIPNRYDAHPDGQRHARVVQCQEARHSVVVPSGDRYEQRRNWRDERRGR